MNPHASAIKVDSIKDLCTHSSRLLELSCLFIEPNLGDEQIEHNVYNWYPKFSMPSRFLIMASNVSACHTAHLQELDREERGQAGSHWASGQRGGSLPGIGEA